MAGIRPLPTTAVALAVTVATAAAVIGAVGPAGASGARGAAETSTTRVVGAPAAHAAERAPAQAPTTRHAAPATQRSTDAPSLTGRGKLYRPGGDTIWFTFRARGLGPDGRGTFRFQHDDAWAEARVDCLVTGGPVASVTGVITKSSNPKAVRKRVGLSVLDQGRKDRLGYSWLLGGGPTKSVPRCLAIAPFETVERGNFSVHHYSPMPEA